VKELRSYEKEIEREVAKTAEMKDKGADPYDLKQQVCIPASKSLFLFFIDN
jgi:tubulin-specific chaperone A